MDVELIRANETGTVNKSNIVRPSDVKTIKCSNCAKNLAQIHVVKLAKDSFFGLIVECPFCKDKSFAEQINGRLNIHPYPELTWVDIVRDEVNMNLIYKTRRV